MSRQATEQPSVDLGELYATHRDRLVNLATRWTRNRHDAEDAVHEAFAVALVEIATVQPVNPGAWLSAITRHRALALTVGYARTVPAGDAIDATPQAATPDTTNDGLCMADPDTALYVLAALQELPPRQREALRLWAIEGLSWPEVAERMGIAQGSARHAAYASLRRLRSTT